MKEKFTNWLHSEFGFLYHSIICHLSLVVRKIFARLNFIWGGLSVLGGLIWNDLNTHVNSLHFWRRSFLSGLWFILCVIFLGFWEETAERLLTWLKLQISFGISSDVSCFVEFSLGHLNANLAVVSWALSQFDISLRLLRLLLIRSRRLWVIHGLIFNLFSFGRSKILKLNRSKFTTYIISSSLSS